ncbi:interferon alpha-inducible protein 27-like protein 2A isoform X1 [Elephas maximus indicus]|uniref:interferon alpha-inducible protein 27-like protein 2A isoform X1 n=1 Tax=Elephas maximus indicus TaxID=99487 RepID=UPI0021161559|nr:interferon alpha-inducible protein 27-like protein 2A isoform X1 [Elephas maximus indicus]XP_049754371.1 interferon alpha-inducible protein 27-like protein 2A isoform X1 [Elephas maximus indicus]
MAFAAASLWASQLASSMVSAATVLNLGRLTSGTTLVPLPFVAKTTAAVVGSAVAVGSVPVVLSAIGFTGTGIAASSIAAKMMSSAAIANGGGVAAGSLVATLQSVGAAGLSLASKAILASVGFTFGALAMP